MGTRVLVVDDAATVRLFYRGVLTAIGCKVDEAWNGAEGLEKALRDPPDLMLVDVNMPHLDGYGFLRAVRQEPELQAIPAVMISTESTAADAAQAYAVGANMYLHKPVRPERLSGLVRVLLGMPPA
ncbi:Response regulator [Rhodovastum atsumiense]|uniref:Response regulator n=1 Tax=Rhodovastum atsumiense TaxID=504468 RepID=A0A5M6IPA3_9PROT|nr:response regulator [Rhodovastum atsumiense]KAA5610103.1 response regulator [Rhodovastum atsumiense]CAH2601425.1 Response regulator [Rhodovastum atsumiense]